MKEQEKKKGSVLFAESAYKSQNAQFGFVMFLKKNKFALYFHSCVELVFGKYHRCIQDLELMVSSSNDLTRSLSQKCLKTQRPKLELLKQELSSLQNVVQVGEKLNASFRIWLFSSPPLSKYRVLCLFYVLLRLNA